VLGSVTMILFLSPSKPSFTGEAASSQPGRQGCATTLVIEDLTVRNMVKNHCLARAISDAAWRQFRELLTYKCAWCGRDLVVIDRWYPSSKTCSTCRAVTRDMPLNVRVWTCRCGTTHDRDVNAARNILTVGLAVSACGAGVRPRLVRRWG
ncbi:transposase, partial [Micromonospora sp. NPDC023814]|uniref:RNA-guided endonuclease InsQ/TnpB family protein n=1 Tax=Micromonospora sp. NPDC023814 TaxID=3154596 RepID=UPI003410365F